MIKFLFFISLSLFTASSSFSSEINCGYILNYSKLKSAEERFKKAYCHVQNGNLGEANDNLEKIGGRLSTLEDSILYYRALYYHDKGDVKRAVRYLEKALDKYPDTGLTEKISVLLAEIYEQDGRYDDAADIYERLAENSVSDWIKAKYLKKLGELHEKDGNIKRAFVIYRNIWTDYPTVSFSNYIFEFANKNRLVFIPRDVDYLSRGEYFFSKSLWENALVELEKSPANETALTKAGVSHYKLGNYRKAVELLSEVKNAESLYWIGKSTQKNGNSLEAAKMLSSIHRIYPESEFAVDGLYEAAVIYERIYRKSSAKDIYNILISKYPGSKRTADVAWSLAWLYYTSEDYDKALELFSRHSFPSGSFNEHSFRYWEARTLEKQGKTEKALDIYRELADSSKITYHSYLSAIKTGRTLNGNAESTKGYKKAFDDRRSKQKVELLFELGIHELVPDELQNLQKKSSTPDEYLYIASVHKRLGDFYTAIKFATELDSNIVTPYSYPEGFSQFVGRYSTVYGLDRLLVYSLIREESRFDKKAVSVSNARGLMQLIPVTARETAGKVGISNFNLDELFIPEVNVQLGCFYLRFVLDRFDESIPLALAGYNAGPTRAEEWYGVRGHLPIDEFIEKIPFDETRFYVKRIIRSYGAYKALYEK